MFEFELLISDPIQIIVYKVGPLGKVQAFAIIAIRKRAASEEETFSRTVEKGMREYLSRQPKTAEAQTY